MDDGKMKELRDSLVKNFMELSGYTESEASAIVGPLMMDGLVRKAREMVKE
jgi:hypothetical protein